MENIIIILILFATVAGTIWYFIRAKKRGGTCIHCPYTNQCEDKYDNERNNSNITNNKKI